MQLVNLVGKVTSRLWPSKIKFVIMHRKRLLPDAGSFHYC